MTFSSGFRRSATVVGGVVLSVVLAACSGGSGADSGSPSSGSRSADASGSQGSSGVEIANPKDAAAADVCSLLPAEAASQLGLKTEGEKKSSMTNPEASDACYWESPDGGATKNSFAVSDGRSIQQYYDNPDSFYDFEKMTIAGYPAVRANKGDPMSAGSCGIFLASKQDQVVQSFSSLNAEDTGKVDPCVRAKKALKLSVSSWPAAK
ncbi:MULTISPECIES: DUF3558 domain-containing protein [unclassified Actinopolyspora]|uniref:DUF3558 domain-containing protein n=1 Tax=unclassified Actinopolyspora TaxID=2639451 RepID=UPI0013F625C7|nr:MULTISPECIES: DUF3558 domain-containing protein [unclassified Actinopolyspora]NHD19454.1 DUF3558 family protein [Actinopolyspora sp. BKK2]NHE77394.1 DUF3558 family protein [Actinopolyspora sp. BKK1]